MYVKEAYRLLQKSIIFVEADDIELEENEEVSKMRLVIRIYVNYLFQSIIKFFSYRYQCWYIIAIVIIIIIIVIIIVFIIITFFLLLLLLLLSLNNNSFAVTYFYFPLIDELLLRILNF